MWARAKSGAPLYPPPLPVYPPPSLSLWQWVLSPGGKAATLQPPGKASRCANGSTAQVVPPPTHTRTHHHHHDLLHLNSVR